MKPTAILLVSLIALTGCAAAWGASYHKLVSNADFVRYEYELASVNEVSMDEAAEKHCAQYGKYAVKGTAQRGGYEYITTYQCIPNVGA